MREQPRERQLQQRSPTRFRKLDQSFDPIEILLGKELVVPLVLGDPRVLWYRLSFPIFSRQQAAHEWKEGKKRQPLALAFRLYFVLRLAVQQAVLILYADEARGSGSRVAGFARFPDLRCGEIGASDFAHLTGLHQSVECPQCLCDRNVRIGYVLLIEIDVVRSEPFEARVQ